MKFSVVCLFLLSVIAGCSKKTGGYEDTVFPVVTIHSPLDGQQFTPGQLIPINGSISDNQYIAEVHIHVSNLVTGSLLMDVHIYPAGPTASFSQSLTAVAGVNYKIQVIARDRNVNETNATVLASCN